jgi:hypothetical protein
VWPKREWKKMIKGKTMGKEDSEADSGGKFKRITEYIIQIALFYSVTNISTKYAAGNFRVETFL